MPCVEGVITSLMHDLMVIMLAIVERATHLYLPSCPQLLELVSNIYVILIVIPQSNVPAYHHPLMVISHVILLVYHIMKISVHSHVILDMN